MKLVHILNVAYQVVMIASAAILAVAGLFLVVGSLFSAPSLTYTGGGALLILGALIPWLQRNKLLKPGENPLDIVTGEEFKPQ